MTAEVATIDLKVGRLIAHHRKRKGILQRELAAAIGVNSQRICRYETGHEFVPLARRGDIAQALDLDPAIFADPKLVEVTPDEADLLACYRRICADPTRKTTIHRVFAAIETGREVAPSC